MKTGAGHARDVAREALSEAIARRRGNPIGTPLQALYRREYEIPTEVQATTFWGDSLHVVLPELVSCEIHRYGVIEPEMTSLFIELLDQDAVVFDVGAHLGYFTLLARFLEATVHAFEPSRTTSSLLARNVGDQAILESVGLWSAETTLEFKDFGLDRSALGSFVSSRDPEARPQETYMCDVTTIDAYVRGTGAVPDLIKVDAEGAEIEVLRGAVETLASAQPVVTLEVGDVERGESRRAIDFARQHGYRPFDVGLAGLSPHEVKDDYTYGNVVLLHEKFESAR